MIVPLGFDCTVAISLRNVGHRTCAYPFDWVTSVDFPMVAQIFLRVVRMSDPELELFVRSFFDFSVNTVYHQNFDGRTVFVNREHGISFPHDDVETIEEKYLRRYKRLRDDYQSADRVIVLRASIYRDETDDLIDFLAEADDKVELVRFVAALPELPGPSHPRMRTCSLDIPVDKVELYHNGDFAYHQTTVVEKFDVALRAVLLST